LISGVFSLKASERKMFADVPGNAAMTSFLGSAGNKSVELVLEQPRIQLAWPIKFLLMAGIVSGIIPRHVHSAVCLTRPAERELRSSQMRVSQAMFSDSWEGEYHGSIFFLS
jgi:hypothetical protein